MSAEYEVNCLKRLKRAGKDVDYVSFDHPVTRAMYPNEDYGRPARMTFEQAAEQLAYAMKYWKTAYPDIKFIYCVNFPNHGWKGQPAYYKLVDENGRGDFLVEFEAVLKAAEMADVEFYGVLADNPYDYATGKMYSMQEKTVAQTDWTARVLDLEDEAKNRGLAFALFFNSETAGNEGPEGEYYKSYVATMAPNANDYEDIYIELSANSLWKETIKRIRIDPGDNPGEVYIDFISFEK